MRLGHLKLPATRDERTLGSWRFDVVVEGNAESDEGLTEVFGEVVEGGGFANRL